MEKHDRFARDDDALSAVGTCDFCGLANERAQRSPILSVEIGENIEEIIRAEIGDLAYNILQEIKEK